MLFRKVGMGVAVMTTAVGAGGVGAGEGNVGVGVTGVGAVVDAGDLGVVGFDGGGGGAVGNGSMGVVGAGVLGAWISLMACRAAMLSRWSWLASLAWRSNIRSIIWMMTTA